MPTTGQIDLQTNLSKNLCIQVKFDTKNDHHQQLLNPRHIHKHRHNAFGHNQISLLLQDLENTRRMNENMSVWELSLGSFYERSPNYIFSNYLGFVAMQDMQAPLITTNSSVLTKDNA